MNSKYKKPLIIVGIIIAVLFIAVLILNSIAESKIEKAIKQLNSGTELKTKDISVNLLTGAIGIEHIEAHVEGKTSGKVNLISEIDNIKIEGFGVIDYLTTKNLTADKLIISNGFVNLRNNPDAKNKNFKKRLSEKLKNEIRIGEIEVSNIDFNNKDEEFSENLSTAHVISFGLTSVVFNPDKEKPFTYKTLMLKSEKIKHQLNNFDDLLIDSLSIKDNNSKLKGFKIETRLSRSALSDALNTERDHFNVDFNTISITDLNYGVDSTDKFYFSAPKISINSPSIAIYRDKLVADDNAKKPMYSEMLRNLNFNLNIDSTEIENATLVYEEKVKADEPAGKIDFKDLNATITSLGNIDSTKIVNINVKSQFMGNTPIDVDWSFDVWNKADYFTFKAQLGQMRAEQINQFTTPNLNVKLEGLFDRNYFTISGNQDISQIDMKIKYDNFKVALLKDNGKEENKLLSGLVNLFLESDSTSDTNGFRYGNDGGIERDKTKSIFNFIWLSIKAGLKSVIAGDGERD